MKKKFFLLALICLFPLLAFCEELDEFDQGYDVFTKSRNLKPVSEAEVQQALKQLEERKATKTKKKQHWWSKNKKKKIEGAPLQTGSKKDKNNNDVLQKPYLLVQVVYNLVNNNVIIPQGFYTVDFDDRSNTLLLKQGYNVIAAIKMTKALKEPAFEELYYIKAIPENNGVKFLYGDVEKHFEGFCPILK